MIKCKTHFVATIALLCAFPCGAVDFDEDLISQDSHGASRLCILNHVDVKAAIRGLLHPHLPQDVHSIGSSLGTRAGTTAVRAKIIANGGSGTTAASATKTVAKAATVAPASTAAAAVAAPSDLANELQRIEKKLDDLKSFVAAANPEQVQCAPGGWINRFSALAFLCPGQLSGKMTECVGACRAIWDATYTKCLVPYWFALNATLQPQFDRVKAACAGLPTRLVPFPCSLPLLPASLPLFRAMPHTGSRPPGWLLLSTCTVSSSQPMASAT